MKKELFLGPAILAVLLTAIFLPRYFVNDKPEASSRYVKLYDPPARINSVTDAGEHGIWQPEAYAGVHMNGPDISSWEKEFLNEEQIRKRIRDGQFIPLYEHSDGAFHIDLRLGDAPLSPAENACLTRHTPEPYLFVSYGRVYASGIEYVTGQPDDFVRGMTLPAGSYAVHIYLMGCTGKPAGMADYIAIFKPIKDGSGKFRASTETFDEEAP